MARARKPPRRQHTRTKPTLTEAPPKPVKVAVVTSPRRGRGGFPSLSNDVALVKAAILYADEVELLGLAAGLVHSLGLSPESRNMSLRQMMELTDRVTGSTHLTPTHRAALMHAERLTKRGTALPPQMRSDLAELERVATHARNLLLEGQTDVVESTGAGELAPALDAGIVTVASVGGDLESALLMATGRSDPVATGREVHAWVHAIKQRMIDPQVRLLFDDQSEDHVRLLLREGVIAPNAVGLRLAGTAAVGAGLVSRLPAFPHVPMDELLDFRRDMAAPLTRYRAAVSRFSGQLPTLANAQLRDGVSQLWEAEVAPALLEIDETLGDSSFLKEAARAASKNVGEYLAGGAAIWTGLGAVSELNHMVTAAIAAAPKAGQVLADAAIATHSARQEARRHELFYLHAIDSSMSA
jgi:hypothetical protein